MGSNSNSRSVGPNSNEYGRQKHEFLRPLPEDLMLDLNSEIVDLPPGFEGLVSVTGRSAKPSSDASPKTHNDANGNPAQLQQVKGPPGFEGVVSVADCLAERSSDASENPGHSLRETCKDANGNPAQLDHVGKGPPGFERVVSVADCSAKPSSDASQNPGHSLNETSKDADRNPARLGKGPPGFERVVSVADWLREPSSDAFQNPGHSLSGTLKDANGNPAQLEHEGKGPPEPSRNNIFTFTTDVTPTRVLCSKTHEKYNSPVQNNAAAADSDYGENNRIKRNEKQMKQSAVNEFSRIKTKLRYLLHRIKYEQNLIDAYTGEGWKGKSLEKIKPEKELQRAKSGIFTYKLKIRDLFQRIDMLLAEGRLPESLFDSNGLIDNEDIFCAKCSSKDLAADNDIILCDGACERGFHQLCLEPPLLKEDIPPGDEVWLCPGCVCKLDCFSLLNGIQGTNLSLRDSWEKVFPEEAATVTLGKKSDDIPGLPSDDSEDDDYNPDNQEVEENVSEDESISEESDYFSASDDLDAPVDLAVPVNAEALPSEDSEDDDYDPDAPDHDAKVMQESSGSDFTSDSEDFGPVLNDNRSQSQDQHEKTKTGEAEQHTLKDELSNLKSNDELVSEKRQLETLNNKKLPDETCRSTYSDFGDEENGCTAPKRKNISCKAAQNSSDQTAIGAVNSNVNQCETEHTTEKRSRKRLKVEGSVTPQHGSSSKRNTKSKYGEDAIKRLFESFKENQYPKRDVKESLAAELGLTAQQVSKWFENARWSFHHSSTSQSKNQS